MDKDYINKAVTVLNNGGIIIYPTDTAFGIGCRIDFKQSVKKLFKIRLRPETQAVPVLVGNIVMAEKYLDSPLPDNVRRLMKDFWPGALTVIYKCNQKLVSPLVRGGGKNLGVRMPDHGVILEIINRVGVPILGPSANFHGQSTPFYENELDPELVRLVDYLIKGVCKSNRASTVLDVSSKTWQILRQGTIKVDFKKYL